ncbi:hypothetical protein [Isoptericola sp. NPDC019482]|uniref:hypothetical protein n=1 Tax=Isoptericola sp. NPDC019482 TaxID=3154688 RepID=UPI00347B4781
MLSAAPAQRRTASAAVLALLVAMAVMVPGLSAGAITCPEGQHPVVSGNGIETCAKDSTQTEPDQDPGPGNESSGPSAPRECVVPGADGRPDFVVDCHTPDGDWSDSRLCYEKLVDPQPPKSDPLWEGHDEGYIVTCQPSRAWCDSLMSGDQVDGLEIGGRACVQSVDGWQENLPGVEPADPEELAREAFASLPIDPIDIGIVPEDEPGRVGLVGMPTWMWAEGPSAAQVGPQSASSSDQGLTVTLDARVDRVVWDMGDGNTETCYGPGTPYEDSYGKKESPDCGYVYTRQGEYQVSATTYWVADWTGGGQSGQLTAEFASPATTITVGELQVLTQ